MVLWAAVARLRRWRRHIDQRGVWIPQSIAVEGRIPIPCLEGVTAEIANESIEARNRERVRAKERPVRRELTHDRRAASGAVDNNDGLRLAADEGVSGLDTTETPSE